jgi:hypothetical protein
MNRTTPVSTQPLEDLDQLEEFLAGRYQEGKPETEFRFGPRNRKPNRLTIGRVAGILNPPERGVISDLAFGGKNLGWLYVAECGRLFRRSVKVTGAAVGSPTKPPKPPLGGREI